MRKRLFLLAAAAAAGLVCAMPVAMAQAKFPTQPVKLVVPYPPGGGTDFFARTVAQGMGDALGQPVIVENRPGASGMIAGQYVAKVAPADGHTVLWGDMTTYAVNPTLFGKQQQYDIQRDLAPVTMTAKFDFMLVVNPKIVPVSTVQELIAAAAKAPDGLNYGNPSIGTTHHLATELFARETGAKLVGITYKGGGAAVQDLLGGQIGLMFLDRATAKPHIETGSLRAIAVAGSKRVAAFPNVPTVAESGVKGFNVEGWQGLTVRAGTPETAVKALAQAFAKAIAAPGVREKLADAGIDVAASTPQEFATYIQSETARWAALIRANGIKVE
ncbi:MAG: tripartite tricarboxylate transporter substrate binding protein [Variovorax sp.]|nr:tripartite tricarboxylate transporter substrate binding protein [Variovorax sp.]